MPGPNDQNQEEGREWMDMASHVRAYIAVEVTFTKAPQATRNQADWFYMLMRWRAFIGVWVKRRRINNVDVAYLYIEFTHRQTQRQIADRLRGWSSMVGVQYTAEQLVQEGYAD